MGNRESAALDRHITGNYGEDQFKNEIHNDDLNWRIGDVWLAPGQEHYILARMNDPKYPDRFYTQLIGMKSGNRYSEQVIVRQNHGEKNCCIFSIDEITYLIYGRMHIGESTSDEDNKLFGDLEDQHQYGPEWE